MTLLMPNCPYVYTFGILGCTTAYHTHPHTILYQTFAVYGIQGNTSIEYSFYFYFFTVSLSITIVLLLIVITIDISIVISYDVYDRQWEFIYKGLFTGFFFFDTLCNDFYQRVEVSLMLEDDFTRQD